MLEISPKVAAAASAAVEKRMEKGKDLVLHPGSNKT
jgi:hypothetical protein